MKEASDAGVPASLCRLFRTDVLDPVAAGFELCEIVLSDNFPHYVHAGFWAWLRWRRHGRKFVFERVDFLRDCLDALCGLFQPNASTATILGDELDACLFEGRANCLDGSFLKYLGSPHDLLKIVR